MPILNWLTRDNNIRAASRVPYRLLEEAPALSAGDPASGNMLIQGDHLDALKALSLAVAHRRCLRSSAKCSGDGAGARIARGDAVHHRTISRLPLEVPMAENSAIEWTDTTWNPVTGCTKISAGCDNCYAARFSERFRGVPGIRSRRDST